MTTKLQNHGLTGMSRGDRLDMVCDRFEAAWQSGGQPSLEDHLAQVEAAEQTDLLVQLLPLEIEYRLARGEAPTNEEFLNRFAAFRATIEQLLGQQSTLALKKTPRDRNPAARDDDKYAGGGEKDLLSAEVTVPRQRFGGYEIVAPLGRGGMGTVYLSIQSKLKRTVALKVISADAMHEPEYVARFLREMEAVGRLDDPHIVRAYDAGEVDGVHYLAMEYVDGVDGSRLASKGASLRVADACELVRQAALGLQHAYEHGLVHRDIKPSNLLVSRAGIVKVADLGLARIQTATSISDLTNTNNQILGTVDYMAPEQAVDSRGVDIRADLYSLGCTLYRFVAGRPPFSGPAYDTTIKKVIAHANAIAVPLREYRSDIPPSLDALVSRLLAKAPGDRGESPQAIAEALSSMAVGSNIALLVRNAVGRRGAPDISTVAVPKKSQVTGKSRLRSRRSILAGMGLVGAGLAGAGWFAFGGNSTTELPTSRADEKWRKELGFLPQEVLYPGHERKNAWSFDDATGGLVVEQAHPCLIQLGTLAAGRWLIGVDLEQESWIGQCGLYLGYAPSTYRNKPSVDFHEVEVALVEKTQPMLRVTRRKRVITRGGNVVDRDYMTSDLPLPERNRQRLEVEIGRFGLVRVRWCETEVSSLVAETLASRFAFEPAGDWGLFTFANSQPVKYSNPQITQLKETT